MRAAPNASEAVFAKGVYGWRVDPGVRPYRGYKALDPPPEPEPFTAEAPNAKAGWAELAALGVMPPPV